MTKPTDPSHVSWRDLANYTDAQALEYFQTVKGMDSKYAANSLRFLRSKYGHGTGEGAPAATVPHTPTPAAQPHATASQTHAQKEATPMTTTTPAAIATNDQGMQALATLLAPHMTALVAAGFQAKIDAAILDKFHVIHVHVPNAAEPVKIEGTTHRDAAKIIKLAAHGTNVLMSGPAGCGKTMIAHTVGQALQRSVTTISCSAGMSEAQLLGRLLPMGAGGAFVYVESPFVKAYRTGGVILLDEMDAADANLLLVINAALANGGLEIEARAASGLDTYVKRHANTVILAAANTWGSGADAQYVGRSALDASTLDRFYKVAVDYDHTLESQLGAPAVVTKVHTIRALARAAKLRRVVSTRMINRLSVAMLAGLTMEEAIADETVSWTREERTKVGLAA